MFIKIKNVYVLQTTQLQMYVVAVSKSAFSIIGNQLVFYRNSCRTDIFYTLHVTLTSLNLWLVQLMLK